MTIAVGADRLARAKRGFTTRNVPPSAMTRVSAAPRAPQAGDLVLARVTEIGQHRTVELPTSRKATLFQGDEVVLAYGNRYAPDQFEALVPEDLGPCHMAAAGGVAGRVVHAHAKMHMPTAIEPVGVFVRPDGRAVNLADFALPTMRMARSVPAIAVVGGSMNAGKTTAAAALVHGLTRAGHRVGAAKLTGTGAGNDSGLMRDAGAELVLDFTDAGLATTYRTPHRELERCVEVLSGALVSARCDVMVFEIADGLFQQETRWLVEQSRVLRQVVSGWMYAGESAASVVAGAQWLEQHGLVVGVSGVASASPLACREIEAAIGMTCLTREALWQPETARGLLQMLEVAPARVAA